MISALPRESNGLAPRARRRTTTSKRRFGDQRLGKAFHAIGAFLRTQARKQQTGSRDHADGTRCGDAFTRRLGLEADSRATLRSSTRRRASVGSRSWFAQLLRAQRHNRFMYLDAGSNARLQARSPELWQNGRARNRAGPVRLLLSWHVLHTASARLPLISSTRRRSSDHLGNCGRREVAPELDCTWLP